VVHLIGQVATAGAVGMLAQPGEGGPSPGSAVQGRDRLAAKGLPISLGMLWAVSLAHSHPPAAAWDRTELQRACGHQTSSTSTLT